MASRFDKTIDEILLESVDENTSPTSRAELIGILGHELRSPLAAIIMGASFLNEHTLDDRQSRVVNRIMNSAKRMNRMVSYLLDLIRIKHGNRLPVMPLPIDLSRMFLQVIAELQMVYPERVVNFEYEGDMYVTWDEDRMAQVMSNLVGNALHHGTGSVDVIVNAINDDIRIHVVNGGPVIPPDLLKTIFEPMVCNEPKGGLGLGLHIAQKIIQAHQGEITVTSTKRSGTTFSICLPRHCSP